MKKILFLLLLPITCFAQSEISNFWEYSNGNRRIIISDIINDEVDSYMIFKDVIESSDSSCSRYVPILFLKADGTFFSRTTSEYGTYFSTTTSECSNDCFYYSDGTFKKIDETHIQLQIKESGQAGLCRGESITNTEPRDLGIFEIKTYEDGYILIKINNK
ncbi:hypothetical protein ABX014_23180 [Snodgrassella alvi]|uniref:hypothetical protein n=1 Tax=Snodgrassella alvi TaxID=1196083 RepID=UPI00351C7631